MLVRLGWRVVPSHSGKNKPSLLGQDRKQGIFSEHLDLTPSIPLPSSSPNTLREREKGERLRVREFVYITNIAEQLLNYIQKGSFHCLFSLTWTCKKKKIIFNFPPFSMSKDLNLNFCNKWTYYPLSIVTLFSSQNYTFFPNFSGRQPKKHVIHGWERKWFWGLKGERTSRKVDKKELL